MSRQSGYRVTGTRHRFVKTLQPKAKATQLDTAIPFDGGDTDENKIELGAVLTYETY